MRWIAGVVSCFLCACGGNGGVETFDLGYDSLGQLESAVEAARTSPDPDERRDSDGDSLPDVVEARLGTDPFDRDSDRDGLDDNTELFKGGEYDRADPLPDEDRDGRVSARDADDDGDGRNDGESLDSDGDGIPNYLEFYGFTYDFLTGRVKAWDGDESVARWFTDPLQYSTDQDAYSDRAEATGENLDPSLRDPGTDPLIPAYPNIAFQLVGYSVTLNEDVQVTEGQSLARGRTWSREMSESHSHTNEQTWEAGAEVNYSSKDGWGGKVWGSYGETYSDTNTTSTSVASGGSVLDEQSWSEARSMNPTDAARIKLFLKVRNRGTAPLSTVIPTLTLKIGGMNIATFEPGNSQINMLPAGGTYPAEPGVAWVVDTIDTGTSVIPLSLTMSELRALEQGAPVSVSVTQLLGDVMRLDASGKWERLGDINEYIARCDAVCANIRVDLGDGQFVHHLVYADDGPSAPRLPLQEALRKIGIDEEGELAYTDRDGAMAFVSVRDFTFAFDDDTLRDNGWKLQHDGYDETEAPADVLLGDMVLRPGSTVFLRAPRSAHDKPDPTIQFAYLDPLSGEVKVSASDYQGVVRVYVTDEDGNEILELDEDATGGGYYSGEAQNRIDSGAGDLLTVHVLNLNGYTAERELGRLFVPPGPQLPVINAVSLDIGNHRIYANVSSGNPGDPISDVDWVRVYHAGLPDGFLELELVSNAFEDPDGYAADLPATFANTNVRVVAFVTDGVYTAQTVSQAQVVTAHRVGSVTMNSVTDTTGNEEDWWVPAFDLDAAKKVRPHHAQDDWSDSLDPKPPYDFWVWTSDNSHKAYMKFNAAYVKFPAGTDYDSLTLGQIVAADPSSTASLEMDSSIGVRTGDVFGIRTTAGRYAKLRVTKTSKSDDGWTNTYARTIYLDYVTYPYPVADAGPDQEVLFDANKTAIFLNAGNSLHAQTYHWQWDSVPAGSTAEIKLPNNVTANFVPDEAGTYVARLIINEADASARDEDTVTIVVTFPEADAGSDFSVSFTAGDDPVALDGSGSVGASSYQWTVASKPAGSAATLQGATTAKPTFLPDEPGPYEFRLVINAGRSDESEATVTVTVTITP